MYLKRKAFPDFTWVSDSVTIFYFLNYFFCSTSIVSGACFILLTNHFTLLLLQRTSYHRSWKVVYGKLYHYSLFSSSQELFCCFWNELTSRIAQTFVLHLHLHFSFKKRTKVSFHPPKLHFRPPPLLLLCPSLVLSHPSLSYPLLFSLHFPTHVVSFFSPLYCDWQANSSLSTQNGKHSHRLRAQPLRGARSYKLCTRINRHFTDFTFLIHTHVKEQNNQRTVSQQSNTHMWTFLSLAGPEYKLQLSYQ